MFAMAEMLQLLHRTETWYTDETFKVGRAPFTQLFSIPACVKCEGQIKQVPLSFVVMSSQKKHDYKAVF